MKRAVVSSEEQSSSVGSINIHPVLQEIIKKALHTKSERILRIKSLREKCGRADSTIWSDVKKGVLPPPIPIGTRSVGWKESEINACLEARSFASRSGFAVDMRAFVGFLISVKPQQASEAIDGECDSPLLVTEMTE